MMPLLFFADRLAARASTESPLPSATLCCFLSPGPTDCCFDISDSEAGAEAVHVARAVKADDVCPSRRGTGLPWRVAARVRWPARIATNRRACAMGFAAAMWQRNLSWFLSMQWLKPLDVYLVIGKGLFVLVPSLFVSLPVVSFYPVAY